MDEIHEVDDEGRSDYYFEKIVSLLDDIRNSILEIESHCQSMLEMTEKEGKKTVIHTPQ